MILKKDIITFFVNVSLQPCILRA